MSEDVPVKSIATAIRIVDALAEGGDRGLSELADDLDMPKSTVFNHLKTLEGTEFVVNEGGSYRIGCRFLELGAKARAYHDVYEIARKEIDRLASETGEISALVVEEHGYGVFLHREEGSQAVHIDSYVGQRIYLHGAALGKAILATLPRHRVEEIIDRRGLPALTANTVTDRDRLFEELDEIADRGIAFDDQERLDGLRSVAVPLTDRDGELLGSISIAGPTNRVKDETFREEFPARIKDVKKVIELNVQYS